MAVKFRFFDDPGVKLFDFFIERHQAQFRRTIANRYRGAIDPQVYWVVGSRKENEGLSSDPVERTVQRLALSQIGYFFAQRIYARRHCIVLPILTMLAFAASWFMLHTAATTTDPAMVPIMIAVDCWLALVTMFAGTFLAPLAGQVFLPRTPVRQDEIDTVRQTISRCVVRDLPTDTPADLADRPRVLVADAEGRAVTGQVLAVDLEYSAVRAEWANTRKMLFMVALGILAPAAAIVGTWFAIAVYCAIQIHDYLTTEAEESPPGIVGRITHTVGQAFSNPIPFLLRWVALPGFLVMQLANAKLPWVGDAMSMSVLMAQFVFVGLVWYFVWKKAFAFPPPLVIRSLLLDQAVRESGTELLIDKAGKVHFQQLEQARSTQLENAKRDKSIFVPIGHSTGLFAQRRDALAPTEADLPVGLTVADLGPHMMVLGASGTGKTTGVIRPVTKTWLANNLGGLLVLDGKGALPRELDGLACDYTLVAPAKGSFNPLFGLSPDTVADTLADIFGAEEKDRFWSDSARLALRMSAIIIAAHPNFPYTFGSLLSFATMAPAARDAAMSAIEDAMRGDLRLQRAVNYWLVEVPAMPEKTWGGIENMVRTWLANITLHAQLGPWVETDQGNVTIESALSGAKLGLLLPESDYGIGGVAISALCMRRLYDAVKRRGDGWRSIEGQQPVLLAADEVQNLLTRADLETVPVARSLGLHLLFATQNVDGMYKRLDRDGAVQMLGNFASLIALPPRTADSNAYVSQRAGKIWRATVNFHHGLPDAAADVNLYANSGTDKTMQSSLLMRQARYGAPRLSYAIGLWHRAWLDKSSQWLQEIAMPDSAATATNDLPRPNVTLSLEPLVQPDEIDTLLARPGTAIAILNRGRVQRRDVILLGGAA